MQLVENMKSLIQGNANKQLQSALEHMKKNNEISSSQANMIQMTLKLSKIKVRDVMIPRANMHIINSNDSMCTIKKKITEARHSRYPVTTDNKDEVLGILLAKNILMQEESDTLLDMCIEPFFVPESKRLDILLKEFQKNHTHMAIVKDEYNGVAGLITLEDVIEEILGEIEDEDFTQEEKLSISELSDNIYLIAGKMTLEEINETIGTNLKSDCVDTLGGFLAQHLGYFPKSKIAFEIDGVKYKIEHADAKSIKSVKVILPQKPNNA